MIADRGPRTVVPVRRVHDEDDPLSWTWSVPVDLTAAVGSARREVELVLDTGALRSQLVDDATVQEFRGAERVAGRSHGALGSAATQRVRVARLALGVVEVTDLEIDLVPPDLPGARSLVGLDLLRQRAFALHPQAGRLVWGGTAAREAQPLHLDSTGHLRVAMTWPGLTVSAVLDTGAGVTVVDSGLAERHPGLFRGHGSAPGTDVTGTTVQTTTATVRSGTIGDAIPLGPHRVAFTPLVEATAHLDQPLQVILGAPAIHQLDWWFDLPNGYFAAWPPGEVG